MPRLLKWIAPVLFLCLVVPVVRAQDTPAYEAFVGAAYAREDITQAKFVNGKLEDRYINGIGWHASLTGNANSWIGAVFDFSGEFSNPRFKPDDVGLPGTSPVITINSSTFTYLFGPRLTYRRMKHIVPFGEVLLGPATLRATSSDLGITNIISTTAFASAFGGGVDVPWKRHINIRLIEADYVLTRFRELGLDPNTGLPIFNGERRTQNNLRASAGIVIHFGNR